jgi:transposase
MSQLSAETKHHILVEYIPHSSTHNLAVLAERHGVSLRTMKYWYSRWKDDKSIASLERQPVSDRHTILDEEEKEEHILTPIVEHSQQHSPIHYPDLLPSLIDSTGKKPSLRTIQRYGKEELGITNKHTITRTEWECQ